jgi:hypothetical protein
VTDRESDPRGKERVVSWRRPSQTGENSRQWIRESEVRWRPPRDEASIPPRPGWPNLVCWNINSHYCSRVTETVTSSLSGWRTFKHSVGMYGLVTRHMALAHGPHATCITPSRRPCIRHTGRKTSQVRHGTHGRSGDSDQRSMRIADHGQ